MTSSPRETDSQAPAWASRLESWKEIAGYLGRDVRTAIRWERERSLPVHRVPGGRRQAVFAYREELDAWLAGDSGAREAAPRPWGPVPVALPVSEQTMGRARVRHARYARIGVAALPAAAAIVLLSGVWRGSPVTRVELEGGTLVAMDASGRERWRYAIDGRPTYRRVEYQFVDFSGRGTPDVVVLLTEQPVPTSASDRLMAFSPSGALRWSVEPSDTLAFGGGTYGAPWFSGAWTPMETGGVTRLVWALRHVTWWPSLLLTFDGDGRRLGTFVNAGWIHSIAPLGDRLLISGVSNSADAAMVALIDARNPSGSSPEDPASPFHCSSCPRTGPLRYTIFGRSEINRAGGFDINTASILRFDPAIEVRTQEALGTSGEAVYEITPDLSVVRARFGDRYWDLHRRLETEGRLTHAAATCPERAVMPAIRTWTAEAGWR